MIDAYNPYASWGMVAAEAETNERAKFIRLTYLHLLGAVLAFVGIEAFLQTIPAVRELMMSMLGARFGWLVVMGAFVGVSYLANYWASSSTSVGMQYLGLGLYVVAQAVIFVPLIMIAMSFTAATDVPVLGIAAALTIATFVILTAIVFLSGADFSFMGPFLGIAGIIAMGVIVCSILFSFNLGIIFIGLILLMSAGYILYDTSNVLHHYRIGQHVGASLALFASVALMFWYMIQLVMSVSSRD